jgi:acyl dehydratase
LLRFSNSILARNVELGPWIHVGSDVTNHAVVGAGQTIEVRAVVLDEFERKGHRFVTLDVAVLADGALAQRVTHTAIHTPRRG